MARLSSARLPPRGCGRRPSRSEWCLEAFRGEDSPRSSVAIRHPRGKRRRTRPPMSRCVPGTGPSVRGVSFVEMPVTAGFVEYMVIGRIVHGNGKGHARGIDSTSGGGGTEADRRRHHFHTVVRRDLAAGGVAAVEVIFLPAVGPDLAPRFSSWNCLRERSNRCTPWSSPGFPRVFGR